MRESTSGPMPAANVEAGEEASAVAKKAKKAKKKGK
jgi:hypothetical protein